MHGIKNNDTIGHNLLIAFIFENAFRNPSAIPKLLKPESHLGDMPVMKYG